MVEETSAETYVFSRDAVLRAIGTLEQCQIHEHFAGYLAILRAQKDNGGQPAGSSDIFEFHDRYLRVEGAPERAPYVRPFRSRGRGLETFNSNLAGSYAPSSLREKGKLIEVIEVTGERRTAAYSLRRNHASLAFDRLLTKKVPVCALAAFIYRDYGFILDVPVIASVIRLFRDEFGLSAEDEKESTVFDICFVDDSANFSDGDLERVAGHE